MPARFRRIIAEINRDSPWTSPTEAQLDLVAMRLDAADVSDIVDALDELSREKDALADWDGDSQDDIARAQSLFAAILARMAARHRASIETRMAGCEHLTRRYLEIALGSA
ncbi:hypothetical protein [Devosia sp. Root635]|uniref:hypothetical protein n=1 Tax=Devosia sp. Root635 TaxID=1736575 RepID=UPI0006FECE78|nr:hypothetical protein [Devosia sp. Root635]KRA47806.1 hypothetical protein ASD80_03155 [Devosia sp. Root635]